MSEKCEFHGCNNSAKYKFKWISYNQHDEARLDSEVYSCRDPVHLMDLSYHPTNNRWETPDELINLETSQKEDKFLEQIVRQRDELAKKRIIPLSSAS